MPNISIVLLCYNEEKNLKSLIEQSKKLVQKFSVEIIIVNNGSKDETNQKLKKITKQNKKIKVVNIKKNIGYGYGVICGLEKAKGDLIGWTHGDDIKFYKKFNKILKFKIKNEKIFIKGFRIGYRPLVDIFFSYFFNIISSLFLRKFLWEITAHPTLFSKKLFLKYKKILPYDFSIDLYLLYLAKKNCYKIERFKFDYDKRKHGVSSWNKGLISKFKLSYKYLIKIIRLVYLEIVKI